MSLRRGTPKWTSVNEPQRGRKRPADDDDDDDDTTTDNADHSNSPRTPASDVRKTARLGGNAGASVRASAAAVAAAATRPGKFDRGKIVVLARPTEAGQGPKVVDMVALYAVVQDTVDPRFASLDKLRECLRMPERATLWFRWEGVRAQAISCDPDLRTALGRAMRDGGNVLLTIMDVGDVGGIDWAAVPWDALEEAARI